MEPLITQLVGLLVIAVLVALGARRLHLPYTVGLVAVGIVLAVAKPSSHLTLTHNLVYEGILPPLLFEAGINIRWKELKLDLLPILTLALAGTVIAACVVTLGLQYGFGWPIKSALLFGILIAATDPVAVIAMFKDNNITGRLCLLTESESLFNDAVAAVLFTLAMAWATSAPGSGISFSFAIQTFAITVGGAMLIGGLCAAAALAVAGRTGEHLVEGTITFITAYGAFQAAEHFGGSGVLATIIAGLLVGNLGVMGEERYHWLSIQSRDFTLSLWEFIAFIANSVIFLLIGMTTERIPFSKLGALPLVGIIALVLLSRALSVYPLGQLLKVTSRPIEMSKQHVLWWGGLRGALGLALALSLPGSIPRHDEMLIATFGVVAFSVLIQGITMPLLLRRLGFIQKKQTS